MGNNHDVIYAVAILIIVAFSLLYLAFKPKVRETYSRRIENFDEYLKASKTFVKSLPLPKKSTAKLNVNMYVSSIK